MERFEDCRQVNSLVDEFCDEYLTEEKVRDWVHSCGIPRAVHEAFFKSTLGAYCMPVNLGGIDCPFIERAALITRITQRAGAMMPFLTDMLTCALLSTMRAQSQQEIEDEFLERTGALTFSQAFSEMGAGTDASAVETTVTVEDGVAYIDGEKTFVSGGQFSSDVLVLARDPLHGQADGGLALWLIPIDAPGVSTFPLNTVGQEMLAAASVKFDRVKLLPHWQIQTEGKLSSMMKRQYDLGRILICASSLGLASAAMDDVLNHAATHMTKGQILGTLPQIQEKLTDMEVKLRAMEMLIRDAAHEADTQEHGFLDCALMKRFVPKAATEVASEALQIFGGIGYTDNTRVGRIWRDCRGNQIAQGTDEVMVRYAAKLLIERR